MRPLLFAVLLLAGCTGPYWGRLESPRPTTFPPDQRIQVWRGGRAIVLREVQLSRDSIVGLPDCMADTVIAVRLHRAEVDSLKQAQQPGAGGIFLAGVAGALAMGWIILSSAYGDGT